MIDVSREERNGISIKRERKRKESHDIFKVDQLNVEKEIRIKFILGRRELKKKKLQHDSQLDQIIAVILFLLLLLFIK